MNKQIDYEKIEKRARGRKILIKVIVYAMLALWAILVLFPFYWMMLTSFKSYASYNGERIPQFITLSPTIENYIKAFSAVPLAK